MFKGGLAALSAVLIAGGAAAQDAVIWEEDVNGWRVAIDRTINNSCFIFSSFENEQYLRLQFNAVQEKVQFIVANKSWDTLKSGQDYEVELSFGDVEIWAKTAKGLRWQDILPSLVLSFPVAEQKTQQFMTDFTAKANVSVLYGGAEITNLALDGAEEAVASMLECHKEMSAATPPKPQKTDPFKDQADQI
jgi:hypothetical protein